MTPRSRRSPNAKEQAELAGLGTDVAGASGRGRHRLAVPINPHFDDHSDVAGESVWDDWVQFDGVKYVELDPADTRRCLWDFVDLVPDSTRRQISEFAAAWGLPSLDIPALRDGSKSNAFYLNSWREMAFSARDLLQLISATEGVELIAEDALQGIAYREMSAYDEEFDIGSDKLVQELWREREHRPMTESEWEARWKDTLGKKVLDHWRSAKRDNRGLEIQRRLSTRLMYTWLPHAGWHWDAVWDGDGRRITMITASGVIQIVASHLIDLFGSAEMAVYTCSMCWRPFEFDPVHDRRRPKAHQRRFCGDDCRSAARRVDNLASWPRNKSRWTRPQRPEVSK